MPYSACSCCAIDAFVPKMNFTMFSISFSRRGADMNSFGYVRHSMLVYPFISIGCFLSWDSSLSLALKQHQYAYLRAATTRETYEKCAYCANDRRPGDSFQLFSWLAWPRSRCLSVLNYSNECRVDDAKHTPAHNTEMIALRHVHISSRLAAEVCVLFAAPKRRRRNE